MPKGKTNSKLTFVIPSNLFNHPMFVELQDQGHDLVALPEECLKADIVFGVNCHILTSVMLDKKGIIDVALKAARKRKKEQIHDEKPADMPKVRVRSVGKKGEGNMQGRLLPLRKESA
jgi:hypothetical protein